MGHVDKTAEFNANHTFLCDEFFSLTLMAAVQRGDVYAPEARESARKKFRSELRRKLEEIASAYRKPTAEDIHLKNICSLADRFTNSHAKTLKGGRFRIGTAQKALNLYLKYLWCLGTIPEPPHCPFDFQIIKGFGVVLARFTGQRWTISSVTSSLRCRREARRGPLVDQPELEAYNAVARTAQEN